MITVAIPGLENFAKVLQTFNAAKSELGEILSAVEVMDSATIEFGRVFNKVESPIGDNPFYLLIETAGSNEQHDYEKLNTFLELALEKQLVLNGTVVQESIKKEVIVPRI